MAEETFVPILPRGDAEELSLLAGLEPVGDVPELTAILLPLLAPGLRSGPALSSRLMVRPAA